MIHLNFVPALGFEIKSYNALEFRKRVFIEYAEKHDLAFDVATDSNIHHSTLKAMNSLNIKKLCGHVR